VVNAAFTVSNGGSNTTLTTTSGQPAKSTIIVTGASGFSGQVTFACSGLPANASCEFNPATLAVSSASNSPSTLSASVTTLTINTAASAATSQARQDGGPRSGTVAYSLASIGLLLLWPVRRRKFHFGLLLICTLAFTALAVNGCSGGVGSSGPTTAPGTYNFTVTASSGNFQTQSAYTLVVQ
jgi:hypothetical protein